MLGIEKSLWRWIDAGDWKVLRGLAAYRLGYWFLCWLIIYFVSFRLPIQDLSAYSAHSHWPPSGKVKPITYFTNMDGETYLWLAKYGYRPGDIRNAFYPAWPLLLRAAAWVCGGHLEAAAVVLPSILSWMGAALFYLLVRRRWGRSIGIATVILWLAFPGAVFFVTPHSEPLFFLLLMVFWWGLETRRVLPAAVAGFLLPMARPIGALVLWPLGWDVLEEGWRRWRQEPRRTGFGLLKAIWKSKMIGVIGWVLVGWVVYFELMTLWTGNPFAAFEAEKAYLNSPSVAYLIDIPRLLRSLVHVEDVFHPTGGLVDRLCFVVMVLTLPAMWRLDRRYFWWGLAAGVMPAMGTQFVSYTRFVEMVFPMFLVLALWLGRKERRGWFWYTVSVAGGLQIVLLFRHLTLLWTG